MRTTSSPRRLLIKQPQRDDENAVGDGNPEGGSIGRGEDTADREGTPRKQASAADNPRHGELSSGGGEASAHMPPNADSDKMKSTSGATAASSSSSEADAAAAATGAAGVPGEAAAGQAAATETGVAQGRGGSLANETKYQTNYGNVRNGSHVAAREIPTGGGEGGAHTNHHDSEGKDEDINVPDGTNNKIRTRDWAKEAGRSSSLSSSQVDPSSTRRSQSRNSSTVLGVGLPMEGNTLDEDGGADSSLKGMEHISTRPLTTPPPPLTAPLNIQIP